MASARLRFTSERLRSDICPLSASRGPFHKFKKNRSEPAVIAKRLTALSIQVRIKPLSNLLDHLLYASVMQTFMYRFTNAGVVKHLAVIQTRLQHRLYGLARTCRYIAKLDW